MLLVWLSQQRHRGVKPSANTFSEGAEAACARGFSRLGSRWGEGGSWCLWFFLTLKIRVLSCKFLFLFSDMQAQQISVFCCWLVHVLQTVISVSKNGLYSKAAGAGHPVSISCGEAVFLHSLWYDYVMTSEVYVLSQRDVWDTLPSKLIWETLPSKYFSLLFEAERWKKPNQDRSGLGPAHWGEAVP